MPPTLILLLHAFVIWVLCGATMFLGRAAFGVDTALIIHLVAAPIWAGLVSLRYFRRPAALGPLTTAFAFLGFAAAMDAGLVAPVFEKSFVMFRSVVGVWLPFVLIFLATLITGIVLGRAKARSGERG